MLHKLAVYHKSESIYSFPISENEVVIRLRMAKEDKDLDVKIVYNDNRYKFYETRYEKNMQVKYIDDLFSYFEVKLKLEDKRLGYIFKINDGKNTYYYHENGITKDYDYNYAYYNFFQIPYINKEDIVKEVKFMKNSVFYQIFVERFNRANYEKDDSYIDKKWGELPTPTSFSGGDLKGITKKLGYLKDLGINAIYLTPIFKANSNHKYDTLDYFEIDPHFGTKKDLKELVDTAHSLGIKIVLDAVFNHISSSHKFFLDVIENGKNSKYYDWFLIKDDYVDLDKMNYEVFADVAYMPKLNIKNEEVKKYLIEISKHYLKEYDIDGWRLDVADELSHTFWQEFNRELKAIKKDFVIIGEDWHDSQAFLRGNEWDSIMNYGLTKIFLDYFAMGKISIKDVANRLNSLIVRNIDQINTMNLNLLDSHDTPRLMTLVKKEKNTFLSSLAMLFTYIGTPCIYYGTEIGLEGNGDPDCRRTFEWDFNKIDINLHNTVKKLIEIRKLDVFKNTNISIYEEDKKLYIKRYDDKNELTLIIAKDLNYDESDIILSSKDYDNKKGINFVIKYQ
ncbi:glycoside hydrolase family 13 protein [Oceanivirga miroungae]|uniref:Alpha,alpha-phosphotrehalase n=1 Tax=Oceanivirga miroungae TaxID=1130046 RepID=A0A6I8MDL0_9FUSO|nr:glycoside hydrolase family 13 protein [Oceanivirga miroungae]VWL85181.1 alpha,alpha-phosphotrehalase [Oceanivirga miroungae]